MIIIAQHVITMTTSPIYMCRAHRQANNNQGQKGQQSPQICIYCGSTEHSSSNCHRRPWDNREQPHSTPESLRRDQQANPKILGNATGRTASMGGNTQVHPPQSQFPRSNSEISGNTGPNNKSSQHFRNNNYNYDYRESQRQPHGLMKGTIRGTHLLYSHQHLH